MLTVFRSKWQDDVQSPNEHSPQSCKEEVLFDFVSSELSLEHYIARRLVSNAKMVSLLVSSIVKLLSF